MRKKVFYTGLILLATLIFLTVYPFAQEGSPNISVNPQVIRFRLDPGQNHSGNFLITNNGQKKLQLSIKPMDFTLSQNGNLKLMKPGNEEEFSLADYISYEPAELTVGPGESKAVNFEVNLPEDVEGVHWTSLVVSPKKNPEKELDDQSGEIAYKVEFNFRYVVALLQSPNKQLQPQGKLSDMDVSISPNGSNERTLSVKSTFDNFGRSIMECHVQMEVRNSKGETLTSYSSQDHTVLPKSKRVFSHDFNSEDFGSGKYLIITTIDYGGQRIVGGQHQITIPE